MVYKTFKPSVDAMINQIGIHRAIKSPITPIPVFDSYVGSITTINQAHEFQQKLNNYRREAEKKNAHLNLADLFRNKETIEKKQRVLSQKQQDVTSELTTLGKLVEGQYKAKDIRPFTNPYITDIRKRAASLSSKEGSRNVKSAH